MTGRANLWTALGSALFAIAVIGTMATVIDRRAETSRAQAPRIDAAQLRYRFSPTAADDSADLAATIAILDERNRAAPSPHDAAELAEAFYRRAQIAGDRSDYATSERYAVQSLSILRTPNAALVTLAKLRNTQHRFREAIALATEHLAAKRAPGAYLAMATAHLALGELAHAEVAAERALALRPDSSGLVMRALVRQARGRDTEAGSDFERAVALEQAGDKHGSARLRALWARLLLRRGDAASARVVLDEALRIAPDHAFAIAQRGELLLRTGNPREAARQFERAFELSKQVRYLMDEARARELAGQRDAANALRTQIETIVRRELVEDSLGHTVDLIEVLADRGTPDALAEAIELGRHELTRRTCADVRFHIARALYRAGQLDEAWAQIDAAMANGAREAALYELAARVEQRRGHADGAATFVRLADSVDPDPASGWRGLGLGVAP